MTDEQIVLLFKRIKVSDDGPTFIEFLEQMRDTNYKLWKKSEGNDIYLRQGFAICVDSLLDSFAECTKGILETPSSFTTWSNE